MRVLFGLALILLFTGCLNGQPQVNEEEGQEVNQLYEIEGLDRESLSDVRIKRAMQRIPRHEFVPEEYEQRAYEDSALPIGFGQTISQPFMVGLMTHAANVRKGHAVLEIGPGRGYQPALLSEIGAEVYSVEILPELSKQAGEVLSRLGYQNVHLRVGDGWQGWPEEAPFDAIIVTASAPKPPVPLLEQLADGGRMIIPLEKDKEFQVLMRITRNGDDYRTEQLAEVRFVPMTGEVRE